VLSLADEFGSDDVEELAAVDGFSSEVSLDVDFGLFQEQSFLPEVLCI
jgi:hypothetical protein